MGDFKQKNHILYV